MTKFYKVLVVWNYDGNLDSLHFYFSTKELAEKFKKQFKKDLIELDDWQVCNKYKLDLDECTGLFSKEESIDIFEELMDERFE